MSMDTTTGEVIHEVSFEWEAGIHPAAELFPMMGGEAFNLLVADIAVNGQRDDIWLSEDGRLLDGRNRLAACQALEIEPRVRTYEGMDPAHFVVSLNVHRRHLTPSQLATVAVEALPSLESEAKAKMLAGKRQDPEADLPQGRAPQSVDLAGSALGVSATLVKQAKRIKAEDPNAYNEVRTGTKTVTEAYRTLTPPPPPPRPEETDEEARARVAAEYEAKQQAQREADTLEAARKRLRDENPSAADEEASNQARKYIAFVLELDPVAAAKGCRDPERRTERLERLEAWSKAHREALGHEGASIHLINGGAS